MKIRERALTLLLSLVMVLTLMPAMAFAGDEAANGEARSQQTVAQAQTVHREAPAEVQGKASGALTEQEWLELNGDEKNTRKALKLEYKGSINYVPAGYDGEEENWFNGFYEEGNEIIITWDEGDPSRYVCREYHDVNSDPDDLWVDYFLNGEDPHYSTYENGNKYIDNIANFDYGIDDKGKITVSYEYRYDYDVTDEDGWEFRTITSDPVQGRYIKELVYEGPPVYYYEEEGPDGAQVYQVGAKIKVVYSNGDSFTTECKEYGTEDRYRDFFPEDEDPNIVTVTNDDGYTYEEATNSIYFDFDWDNITADSLPVHYRGASGIIPISVKKFAKPTKIEFIAPSSYKATGLIGDKVVGLYGKNVEFNISFNDGTKKHYVYKKDKEGYYTFINTEDPDDYFWPSVRFTKRIKKGTHKMSGKVSYTVGENGFYKTYNLPLSVKVKASKYYAYVTDKTYTYTGKKITPKVVVKYWTGSKMKTMPKSWYTCKPKKNSKYGWYSFRVTIKKAYRNKYGKALWGYYEIIPKKPTILKATAGSGSMTVTWKKFTAAEQKRITKFYVEVSKNKNFNNRTSLWQAKKNEGKLTIDGLEKGTKYYVRVVAVKETNKSTYWSKPSAVKIVTVK